MYFKGIIFKRVTYAKQGQVGYKGRLFIVVAYL